MESVAILVTRILLVLLLQQRALAWSPFYHPIPWHQHHHQHKHQQHQQHQQQQQQQTQPWGHQQHQQQHVAKQYNHIEPVATQYNHPNNRHLREVVFELKARMIMSGNVVRAARRGDLPYQRVRQLGVYYPATSGLRYPLEEGGGDGAEGEPVWSGAGVLGPPPGFELEESLKTSWTEVSAEPLNGGGEGNWGKGRVGGKQTWTARAARKTKQDRRYGSPWGGSKLKEKFAWRNDNSVSLSKPDGKLKPWAAGAWQGKAQQTSWGSDGGSRSKVNSIHHVHGAGRKTGGATCKAGLYLADSSNPCRYQQCVSGAPSPVTRPCPPGLAVSPLFSAALSNPCTVYDGTCHRNR